MSKVITIATRESLLAMWQANFVKSRLQSLYPDYTVEVLGMTTKGDQILDRTLSKVGGKGLFVKELETALANGEADLAVHSLKDVPMDLPDGFNLAAVCERANPNDGRKRAPHPTLIGGKDPQVQCAGMITFYKGRILSVDNQSGHYRPNSKSMEKVDAALKKLYEKYPGAFDKNSKWRKE